MNWEQVRIFLEVARSGQILGAARRLGINHATAARNISALEAQLATKLLVRHTSGCTVTTAGEALLHAAERAESDFLQVGAKLTTAADRLKGTVRIGAPDGIGSYFLAEELAALAAQHPELTIQLLPLPRKFSLPSREVDIAITLERPARGRLLVKKLTDYTLSLYASAEYLRRTGPIRSDRDLADRLLITDVQSLAYSRALGYGKDIRMLMPRHYECGTVVAQVQAVRAGHGVAILHDFAVGNFPDLQLVLPEIRFLRSYWLVSHADTKGAAGITEVATYIANRVAAKRVVFKRT